MYRTVKISDEQLNGVSVLAKLELSGSEREQIRTDIGDMLTYIDKLNELDTEAVSATAQIFSRHNVFREDVVVNGDNSEELLSSAPEVKNGFFKVPKTLE